MNKKKKALGTFCTLNPDAGDVEKNIDIFNSSTSDNIGNNTVVEGVEKTEKWEDVYEQFEDAVDKYFPDVDRIEHEIEKIHDEHKGEDAYEKAYSKWTEYTGLEEDLFEGVDELNRVNIISIEDMREGSISNMSDEEIDYQEKLFSNISRKLKTPDSKIVVIRYDEGYYDYNPEYLTEVDYKPDKYGDTCSINDIQFYKESNLPFLYFKSEKELNKYLDLFEEI